MIIHWFAPSSSFSNYLRMTLSRFPHSLYLMKIPTNAHLIQRYFDRQKPRHERSRISEIAESSGGYIRRSQFVDFRLFRSEYWKKFPDKLTKNMEPGLVFAELMGVIKGSATNNSTLKSLSREEYLELNDRQAPTFSGKRAQVYDIYLRYEHQKSVYGDKDSTDRVKSLLKILDTNLDLKRSIEGSLDELYVDGIPLSRYLCLCYYC